MKKMKWILAVTAVIGLAFTAPAQVAQTTLVAATNLPATVATTVTTNCVSYFTVNNNDGFALTGTFNVSAGTSNVVYYLYPTTDGTNYATVAQITNTANANGTTTVRTTFSVEPARTKGVRGYQIGIYNQNSGTLTNAGVLISKPN
jgi:hypothetical protein